MNVANIRRLPVPIMDNWDWQLRGACRGIDSEFFFHPDGERGSGRARREAMAKQVCKGCPVLEQCRRHALAVQEPYGVWGGLSEGERDDIVRGRRRTIRVPLATKDCAHVTRHTLTTKVHGDHQGAPGPETGSVHP